MNLKLRPIEDPDEAQSLAPLVTRAIADSSASFHDDPPAEAAVRSLLERHLVHPEGLLLVAETEDTEGPRALVFTAPFADPLGEATTPLILALWVDPDLRHRGLARAIVGEARRLLEARGFPELAARVSYNDDALISMGERWGFVRSWELVTS